MRIGSRARCRRANAHVCTSGRSYRLCPGSCILQAGDDAGVNERHLTRTRDAAWPEAAGQGERSTRSSSEAGRWAARGGRRSHDGGVPHERGGVGRLVLVPHEIATQQAGESVAVAAFLVVVPAPGAGKQGSAGG